MYDLIINGRRQPYQADAPATLKFQVRRIKATDEVLLDGRPLATIPADTPNEPHSRSRFPRTV